MVRTFSSFKEILFRFLRNPFPVFKKSFFSFKEILVPVLQKSFFQFYRNPFPVSKTSFSRCGRPVSATLVTEASQGWGRLGRLLPPTRYVQLVFGLIFVPLYLSMFLFVFLWNIWKFQYVEARSLGQSMWLLKLVVLCAFLFALSKKTKYSVNSVKSMGILWSLCKRKCKKKYQELKKGEMLNGEGWGRVDEKGKCSMSCVPVILCNVAVEPRRRGSSLLSSLKKANWTHRQGQGEGEGRCK